MAASRPSSALKDKINIRAVGNRINEATAEDFQELGAILEDHADKLDAMTGSATPSPHYGTFTSLELLRATYAVGELDAFAIIDAGTGTAPQIALWDVTDNDWVLQLTTKTTTEKVITQNDNVIDVLVQDANGDDHIIVSGTFTGTDPSKLEHYSANSITRAL
tara:strand:+ start:16076 stop:16564 length:489 start_codon:yes stop_codon:yes gene_type:complete